MLFCTLTNEQRNLYRSYLASAEVADILAVRVPFPSSKLNPNLAPLQSNPWVHMAHTCMCAPLLASPAGQDVLQCCATSVFYRSWSVKSSCQYNM